MPEVYDRAHDRRVVWIFANVRNERLVDLQRVDRKSLQVVERGVAGAEVINRDADSHQLQLVQLLDRLLRIFHDRTLSQLELEPTRIEVRLLQHMRHIGDERRLLKLSRREVYRHANGRQALVLPRFVLCTRSAHYMVAQCNDQTSFFGDRDELAGIEQAQTRMLPAHERFHAHELKAANINLRLVMHYKLRTLDARPDIAFEHELFERAGGAARSVEMKIIAAVFFCPVERDAGGLQQSGSVATVVWIRADADTARHEDLLIVEDEGLIECLLDSARDVRRILCSWNLRQQHCEFIAAETRHCVAFANTTRQPLGH